ncbi:hypothetical protein AB0L53_42935 [Nonomuraea sp. NPDC052129]|uniref:hypothetical protein n=1 Tax=Nonomuraea sp. NPDC052129 TaxID=3154651 RepID=UPI00342D26A6
MGTPRRLITALLTALIALTGFVVASPPASADRLVAEASLHSWHANNQNKTIDTTVKVYASGNVYGVSTVESGVYLTGVRLCAKALLLNVDGMVIGEVGGDCWGVNGTALGYSKRTENWSGQVSPDIAEQTYAVSIVHWNNGIDWGQVLGFAKFIWTVYKTLSTDGSDASANTVVLPRYQPIEFAGNNGSSGGGGGGSPHNPKPNDP